MHAEFESECKKKIERLTNAVKDPSSWDMPEPSANAQPEPRQSKKNSPKRSKKKKKRGNYRFSSHCGGKQLKCWGEQNAETASPDIGNPIIEVHNDCSWTSFKYRDGSMDPLDLCLPAGKSARIFKVPVGQVARVILHFCSYNN
jgi:hypothetical protein